MSESNQRYDDVVEARILHVVEDKLYQVPRTLSLASLLGGMLLFSIIFTFIRVSGGGVFVCLGTMAMVVTVGMSQMLWTSRPREASIVAGAVCLPLLTIIHSLVDGKRTDPFELIVSTVFLVIVGPFIGYAMGSLLAGFWLVADRLEQVREGWSQR